MGQFSIIVILMGLILNFLLDRYPLEPLHYKLQFDELSDPTIRANAVILGTSHAVHAIRPSVLESAEYKFYNFALNGASASYYRKWYKEIFSKQYPSPDYCILAVDWFMFDPEKLWRKFEQDSEHFSQELFQDLYWRSEEFNSTALINNRYPILKYRNQMRRLFKSDRFYREEYDNGFIPVHLDYKPRRFEFKQNPKTVAIDSSEQEQFRLLVETLQNDGITVIFVMTPEYGMEESWYNESKAITYINEIADKNKIPFINYNTDHRDPKLLGDIGNFSDWGHMSSQGSSLFSKALSGDLHQIMF